MINKIILTTISCSFFLSCLGGDIDIHLNLKPGTAYKVKLTTTGIVDQQMGERNMQLTNTMYMSSIQKVISSYDDGSVLLSFEYDSIKNEQSQQGLPAAPQHDFSGILGQVFKGKIMSMHISSDFKVQEVKGFKGLMKEMSDTLLQIDVFNKNASRIKPMIEQIFKKNFSREALQNILQNITGAFPPKPVNIGDTWSHNGTTDLGLASVNTLVSYKLAKVENGRIYLTFTSSLESGNNKEPVEMGPMKFRYEMQGTQQGIIILDSATCWYDSMSFTQEVAGTMHMSMPAQDTVMEMSVPMNIKGKTELVSRKL